MPDALAQTGNNERHIWIVNHYTSIPSKDGGGARHHGLARHLQPYGWSASLILASTTHPAGVQRLHGPRFRRLTDEEGVPTLWVRTSAYGSSLLKRAFGMLLFSAVLLLPGMTRGLKRPDIVMGCTVHPLAATAGLLLARRHRVPFVFEIRDVWPETLVELGQVRRGGRIDRGLTVLIKGLVRRATFIVSPLPFVDKHLEELGFGEKPFLWVPNGCDVDASEPSKCKDPDPFTFMYLGSHGPANGLANLLQAFDMACASNPDLNMRLRLVGDGPLKASLAQMATDLESGPRIQFEERVPVASVMSKAQEADCMVATLLDNRVYRFGVGLNKFYTYMASGRPTVVASSAPNNPIEEAGAGWSVPAGDTSALGHALSAAARSDKGLRVLMGEAGREALQRKYSYSVLADALVNGLNSAVNVEE